MNSRLVGFYPEKAAQVAAFFVNKQDDRTLDKLKLVKLLYLSERASIRNRGRPMFYDEFYSLEHGPICSNALNGINNKQDKDIWSQYLERVSNRTLTTTQPSPELDRMSKSDIVILNSVWVSFGWMSPIEIRNWTHKNCAEYVEVGKHSRLPIPYSDIFRALGYPDPDLQEERVREHRSISGAIAS